MEKSKILKIYKAHLNWMQDLVKKYGREKKLIIEQAFGYTQGITDCNPELFEEISEIWSDWHMNILYKVEQGDPNKQELETLENIDGETVTLFETSDGIKTETNDGRERVFASYKEAIRTLKKAGYRF